ncbi:response regulator transcription factor [Bacillus badius]|uniref:Two-component response regulator n=1 Tax=Bacillus badius TaxID=1455 RepID=A0ABR5AYM2_BACBA|nr:response regulator transcription factor [Bacillus badius]KIL76113.1 Two-component response regulator [Bacillus badius]KIL79323.1 Two-component response regulator [Bacillus badius]KZR59735.1 DNA-binding response regulator [Bacillus badius]MED4716509.1 response regulator transcription factor [Bacillus badius]
MTAVLLAEDELAISQVLKAYLVKAGFHVSQAFDGQQAIDLFYSEPPDLVLLDVMMPKADGWTVLKEIRQTSSCPVIMLTALGDVNYRLKGLNDGADDYIAKPFNGEEVIARVKAVLRRSGGDTASSAVKHYGSLTIDSSAHRVTLKGVDLALTPRDLSVLLFLASQPNRTFTREQLIEHVWGQDYDGSDRAVDLSVKRLRKALQNWPETEGEIKTLRGLGYQFCVHEDN